MHARLPVLLLTLLSGLPAQALDCKAAAAYSARHEGLAVLVYQNGKRIFEEYHNGHRRDKVQHIYSGTKSFASAAALVAQAEGLLKLDEKVAETLPSWREDPRKAKVTIRQLLQFTSGLRNIDRRLHGFGDKDMYRAGVEAPMVAEPGARFRYGSVHLMVFGEVLRRKLAAQEEKGPKDVLSYLQARVFEPIGMKVGHWIKDRSGNPLLPFGAFLTARDWAKFGQLVLDGGRHGKQQLLPKQALAECFVGSKANPAYGLNWWLEGKRSKGVPNDVVGAYGMFKQKLYLVPSRGLVIVRFGKTNTRSSYRDGRFLRQLLKPAADSAAPEKEATKAGEKKRVQDGAKNRARREAEK